VPQTVAEPIVGMRDDIVLTDQIVLSSAPLVPQYREQVAGDQARIEDAYRELSDAHFRIPARRVVDAYLADPEAIAEHITIADASIEARYEEQKSRRWRRPDEPVEDGEDGEDEGEEAEAPEPRYRPLDEVADEIREELAVEAARKIARTLYSRFELGLGRLVQTAGGPEQLQSDALAKLADETSFAADEHDLLQEAVQIQRLDDVELQAGRQGSTQLGDYGTIGVGVGFFEPDVEVGSLHQPKAEEHDGLLIFLRVEKVIPPDQQPLEAVREQIVDYLAARAAYEELLAKATVIAESIDADPDLDLREFFAEGEQSRAFWSAEPREEELGPLASFAAPPAGLGGDRGEESAVISYATEARPVVLHALEREGSELKDRYPRVGLLQVRDYREAEAPDAAQASRMAQSYRRLLQAYRHNQLLKELERREREGR